MDLPNTTTIQGQCVILGNAVNNKMQNSASLASLGNGNNFPVNSALHIKAQTSITSHEGTTGKQSVAQLQKTLSKGNIYEQTSAKHPQEGNVLDAGPAFVSYDMKIGDVSKYQFKSSQAVGPQSQQYDGRMSSQGPINEGSFPNNRRISINDNDSNKRSQKRFQQNYNTTTNTQDASILPSINGSKNQLSIGGTSTAIGLAPNSVQNESKFNSMVGNTRKMSLAAKSGQMQVFNSLQSQNLNAAPAPPLYPSANNVRTTHIIAPLQPLSHSSHGARTTLTETNGQLPPKGTLNIGAVDLLGGASLPQKPPMPGQAYGQIQAGTQRTAIGSLPPQAISQKTTMYSNNGPNSVKGAQNMQTQGLLLGGFDSSSTERQKMNSGGGMSLSREQQSRGDDRSGQREKKQELLKQLDANKGDRTSGSVMNDEKQSNPDMKGLRVDGIAQPGRQALMLEQVAANNSNRRGASHAPGSHLHSNSLSVQQENFENGTMGAAIQLEGQSIMQGNGGANLTNQQASGMYYSSISPTRAQKYLLHQHQQQRGPLPLSLNNMSASAQLPLAPKNVAETSLIKIQSGQDNINAIHRNRFKGSMITNGTGANILPLNMNVQQPLGPVNPNIFNAPNGANNNDFSQYLSYQLQSPQHKLSPPNLQQAQQFNSAEKPQTDNIQQDQNQKGQNFGRPHKMYDYMFIQMSNEMFQKEYAGRKILISSQLGENAQSPKGRNSPEKTPEKSRMNSMPPTMMSPTGHGEQVDLNGIVKIKAYESQLTDELPQVQCNLQPTQLDHLKVLVCEQEDKGHPKLTQDANNRFEIEKQNQIKQYMEDIITKLQQKERRFKVTVKRKFVEDALYNSTQIRVASVYVIVINRDKTFDALLNQRFFKSRKRISNNKMVIESSSEDEETMFENMDPAQREEYLKQQKLKEFHQRRSANSNLINQKKRSLYDSDTNGCEFQGMNSTSASSGIPQFKKLMSDKSQNMSGLGLQKGNLPPKKQRVSGIMTGPNLRRNVKKDDEFSVAYKYVAPVKDFSKYGTTKIKICQNMKAHAHHLTHPFNIFSNQYNEFIKIVLKNQKLQNLSNATSSGPVYKFNYNYAHGLARQLGLQLKKDAFSEANMKSREYVNNLREKLIMSFWKKIGETNIDLTPQLNPDCQKIASIADIICDTTKSEKEEELRIEAETIDSSSNQNNTPKSKQQLNKLSDLTSAPAEKFTLQAPQNIIYKYFIGKGNNSIMVRSLFKNRFWWVQHDKESIENSNFCWTQIRKNPIMEALSCKYPSKKSGIKNVNYNPKVADPSLASNSTGLSSILATPQQKSAKKKRQASQSLQSSDKASKHEGSGSNDGDSAPPTTGIEIGKSKPPQNELTEEQINKKLQSGKLYNKIEDNFHLNNKKALYLNMKNYYDAIEEDVFDNLPVTFHVKTGVSDPEFEKFKQYYYMSEDRIKNKKLIKKQKQKAAEEKKEKDDEDKEVINSPSGSPDKKTTDKVEKAPETYTSPLPDRNIWIIKPGENTNRGHGIQVAKDFDEVKQIIVDSTTGGRRTCIVQKYIHNPLLIHRRKFDIRTFVLFTSVNGNTKVYIYEEGYIRTSCREYSVHNLSNRLVHLTNDAVQKKSEDYGKYEPGNKLSYNEFQMFIDKTYPDLNICFERDIKPQMNKLTTDIFRSTYNKLDPKKRLNCMEVFGLDFMIDDEFKPYLIEVNTNPCLELSSPLLARLIPNMLENSLKIALDSQFLPPEHFSSKKSFIGDPCPENRYELVFDLNVDGPVLDSIFKTKQNIIIEMDEDELSEEEEHDDEEE